MRIEDKDMFYDTFLEQYVLKKDFIFNQIYLDEALEKFFRTGQRTDRLSREISDDIYRYIFKHSLKSTIHIKRWLIEHDEEALKAVKRAMLYQMRYAMRSGGSLLKDMHGVDIERSKVVNISDLRGERTIAQQAIDVLSEHDWLLYQGKINVPSELRWL